jgi:hypothetical protein
MSLSQEEVVAAMMTLRSQTRLTGIIYESQKIQLQYWPCIAVPQAKSSEVSFETDENGGDRKVFVEFKLDAKVKARKAIRRSQFQILEKNIQWLLGNDWKVIISVDGKTVYTGRRRVEPKPQPDKVPSGRKR